MTKLDEAAVHDQRSDRLHRAQTGQWISVQELVETAKRKHSMRDVRTAASPDTADVWVKRIDVSVETTAWSRLTREPEKTDGAEPDVSHRLHSTSVRLI